MLECLLTCVCFRLLARVRWQYFLITLGCCLTDINQVASGAMASANSYRKRVWSRNVLMSTAGPAAGWPLVASCLAYRASHDIWRWTGCTVALYGMLEWCCADVLTLQEVEPHIYTGIRSLLVRERESQRGSESVGVWYWLYTYEKQWDAVWLYGTLNKAKRVDSLSYIPYSYSVLPTA